MNQALSKITNYNWVIFIMLFFATAINYMDRQVRSLSWAEHIRPDSHYSDENYRTIIGLFSFVYAA